MSRVEACARMKTTMLDRQKNLTKQLNSGFTLIELLVVIAIIAILTGLVGSNYLTSRIRARDAKRKSDLRQIQTALEMYHNDQGQYPLSEPGPGGNSRIAGYPWGSPFVDDETATGDPTVYMPILPGDRAAPGAQYFYEANTAGTKYRLCAVLENEEDLDIQQPEGYSGKNCGETANANLCNYCVSSSNTTIDETWTD